VAEEEQQQAAETVETTTQEVSFLDQLVDATGGGSSREETKSWIEKLIIDAGKGQFRIEKKTLGAIDDRIRELDERLSVEVSKVLHHSKFQKLEGSWRGLQRMVENSLLGSDLRIQVMDIAKDELLEDMTSSNFQSTILYDKIYTQRYNMLGGVPIGVIVGDFEFSHAAVDVKGLATMAKVCAVSHAPFLTSPSPKMFGIPEDKGWEVLDNLDDTAIENRFLNPSVVEMTDWRAFREMEDSRYVAMCMPRAMARLPYGNSDCEQAVQSFSYQEFPLGDDGNPMQTEVDKYCWMNAAYTMGQCMSDAFAYYGWAVGIRGLESGGKVEGLPIHYFTSEHSDTRVQCPTEVPLPMSKDAILGKVGFLPLLHEQNTNHAVFIGGQTVHKPKQYDDSAAGNAATANENLSARLPYIMAVSRAAHALQPMLRIQLGKSKEADEIEDYIHTWFVNNFVLDQDKASEEAKARKPFRFAEIKVVEDPTDPGVYNVKAQLRPHFQVEEINVSMSLVASRNE
jgi:type VI secretion system protein ImpC